jgi:hypothetical protein
MGLFCQFLAVWVCSADFIGFGFVWPKYARVGWANAPAETFVWGMALARVCPRVQATRSTPHGRCPDAWAKSRTRRARQAIPGRSRGQVLPTLHGFTCQTALSQRLRRPDTLNFGRRAHPFPFSFSLAGEGNGAPGGAGRFARAPWRTMTRPAARRCDGARPPVT